MAAKKPKNGQASFELKARVKNGHLQIKSNLDPENKGTSHRQNLQSPLILETGGTPVVELSIHGPIALDQIELEKAGPGQHFLGLKKLTLSHCHFFSWQGAKQIIKSMPALTQFVFKDISVEPSLGPEEFLEMLPKGLKSLTLSYGHFSPEFLTAFCRFEGKIQAEETLEQIDLTNLKISTIPRWILTLKNLRRLNLGQNKLTFLDRELKELPRLHHLSVDDNPFSEDEKAQIQRIFNIWF